MTSREEIAVRDAYAAKADAILASDGEGVTSRPSGLPEGWIAVPREPPEEMLICPVVFEGTPDTTIYFSHAEAGILQRARQMIWKAMLAAAPPLSEPTQDGSPQQTSASDGGREEIEQGLADCGKGVHYVPNSPGEHAAHAAYAVLRCCNLIPAGDWSVPERIGRCVQEMSASDGGREMVRELVEALRCLLSYPRREWRTERVDDARKAARMAHAKAREWLEGKDQK